MSCNSDGLLRVKLYVREIKKRRRPGSPRMALGLQVVGFGWPSLSYFTVWDATEPDFLREGYLSYKNPTDTDLLKKCLDKFASERSERSPRSLRRGASERSERSPRSLRRGAEEQRSVERIVFGNESRLWSVTPGFLLAAVQLLHNNRERMREIIEEARTFQEFMVLAALE